MMRFIKTHYSSIKESIKCFFNFRSLPNLISTILFFMIFSSALYYFKLQFDKLFKSIDASYLTPEMILTDRPLVEHMNEALGNFFFYLKIYIAAIIIIFIILVTISQLITWSSLIKKRSTIKISIIILLTNTISYPIFIILLFLLLKTIKTIPFMIISPFLIAIFLICINVFYISVFKEEKGSISFALRNIHHFIVGKAIIFIAFLALMILISYIPNMMIALACYLILFSFLISFDRSYMLNLYYSLSHPKKAISTKPLNKRNSKIHLYV